MSWQELDEWWLGELIDDPAYEAVVTPLLMTTLEPRPGRLYVDLGCGEGRVGREIAARGARVIGLELNHELARLARPSVVVELPSIPIADRSVDGTYSVLVLEHLEDEMTFFAESARVTRRPGVLAIVMNHPIWTATGSTPLQDGEGEVAWRPGDYFGTGITEVNVGEHVVSFRHRSIAAVLNAAASTGWSLEAMVEQPGHDADHLPGIPRLLACRWRLE